MVITIIAMQEIQIAEMFAQDAVVKDVTATDVIMYVIT